MIRWKREEWEERRGRKKEEWEWASFQPRGDTMIQKWNGEQLHRLTTLVPLPSAQQCPTELCAEGCWHVAASTGSPAAWFMEGFPAQPYHPVKKGHPRGFVNQGALCKHHFLWDVNSICKLLRAQAGNHCLVEREISSPLKKKTCLNVEKTPLLISEQ